MQNLTSLAVGKYSIEYGRAVLSKRMLTYCPATKSIGTTNAMYTPFSDG